MLVPMTRRLLPLLALLAWPAMAGGQTHVMSAPVDPFAVPKWEEVFLEGPFDLPDETSDVGDVAPVLTAAAPEANAACRLGLAALHRHDDREAERAFRLAITRDETCAFGYLGLALANDALPGRASAFWQKAKARVAAAGTFERQLVEAYEPFFTNIRNRPVALPATEAKLMELTGRGHPMVEATALVVRWQIKSENEPAARQTLAVLLASNPHHPAATYKLRLTDPADPAGAQHLEARLAACPPTPGALRMAAGRLERAGRFASSAQFLRAAALTASARHPSDMAEWKLVEDARAEEVAMLASAGRVSALEALARDRPAAVRDAFIRLERWASVLALPPLRARAPLGDRAADAHARALAAFSLKQPENAFPFLATLQVIGAEARRPTAGTPPAALQRIEDFIEELQLHNLLGRGAAADVASRWGGLRTIPLARRARLALASGQFEDAVVVARQAAQASFHALPETALLIEALMASGKKAEARMLFDSPFGKIVPEPAPDTTLPAIVRLGPIATALGLPEPWWPKTPPPEIMPKVALASRTPSTPPDAALPGWTLEDGTGLERPFSSLIVEPTVFIFFLGHQCRHCMNQLNTFAPMAGKLRTAGARIVAISTDDSAGVAETFAGATPEKTQQPFPFLILADKEQKAFRAWGVFDQFTNEPIHGVFIVDPAGRLRWRHLGVEPFTQVSEVIAACDALGG